MVRLSEDLFSLIMKVFVCIFVVFLAAVAPTQAFLGKIALLGALSGNVGGQGIQGGGVRPVVTVNNGGNGYDYGYGQGRQYYGGGYQSGGYTGGYQSGGGQVVRVIKVVVPNEQPQPQAQFYSGDSYAGGYTSGWTPVPAPAPVPVPVTYSAPQAVQVSLQSQSVAQNEAVVSPPRSIVAPVQPVQIAQPIPVLQPLPVQHAFPQPQQFVKTIRLIVDGGDSNQGVGFAAYRSSLQDNYGAYKQGGVFQKVDC